MLTSVWLQCVANEAVVAKCKIIIDCVQNICGNSASVMKHNLNYLTIYGEGLCYFHTDMATVLYSNKGFTVPLQVFLNAQHHIYYTAYGVEQI